MSSVRRYRVNDITVISSPLSDPASVRHTTALCISKVPKAANKGKHGETSYKIGVPNQDIRDKAPFRRKYMQRS